MKRVLKVRIEVFVFQKMTREASFILDTNGIVSSDIARKILSELANNLINSLSDTELYQSLNSKTKD